MRKLHLLKNQFLKISPYMPELLGFETMLIIDPYGMAFDAMLVAGLVFSLLFKLVSSYCDVFEWWHTFCPAQHNSNFNENFQCSAQIVCCRIADEIFQGQKLISFWQQGTFT